MRRGRTRTRIGALGLVAAGALAAAPPVANAADRLGLHPIDGGHWQGQVGLPDARGSVRQALVRVVDGSDRHAEGAAITGLEGQDTSAVERLGFTVAGDEAGIIPCVRVAFTDTLGNHGELMIISRTMRAEPAREPGWTVYSFDAELPPGATIEAIELSVHAEAAPATPVRVHFDDVVVNDRMLTHAGDNAGGGPS